MDYSESGEPFTVRYHMLPALLLNEVQREERLIGSQRRQIHAQRTQIEKLQAELAAIAGRLTRLERQELPAAATATPPPAPARRK